MAQTNYGETKYLVTGATGNVGSEVVERLMAAGHRPRVFARDPGRVAHWADRVEVAAGDFQQPDTFARAAEGVEAIFLMNQSPDQEAFSNLIDAAKTAGAPRIIFLSSLAADDPKLYIGRMHKQKEDTIRQSGMPRKFLRPGAFMTNAYQWVRTIHAEGAVYNPLGDARIPPIAPEDIADVAVEALLNPTLSGEEFDLTGGELLSVADQVNILVRVLGRPIRCVDIPVEAAAENLVRAGIPAPLAAAVAEGYQAVRNGRAVEVKDTVERVTGASR